MESKRATSALPALAVDAVHAEWARTARTFAAVRSAVAEQTVGDALALTGIVAVRVDTTVAAGPLAAVEAAHAAAAVRSAAQAPAGEVTLGAGGAP